MRVSCAEMDGLIELLFVGRLVPKEPCIKWGFRSSVPHRKQHFWVRGDLYQLIVMYRCYVLVMCFFTLAACLYVYMVACTCLSSPSGRSGLVVCMSNCGVRGPRFESIHGLLCLSWRPLRYIAFGIDCTCLLQCQVDSALPPSTGW